MDGISIASGALWLAQERDIGLRHIGMNVLQSDAHGTHGDGQIFEAGKQVEQVMRGEGKFCGFDALRRQLQCTKGQGRGQGGRGGGAPRAGRGHMCRGLGISRGLASQLNSIGEGFFMGADEAGEVLPNQY